MSSVRHLRAIVAFMVLLTAGAARTWDEAVRQITTGTVDPAVVITGIGSVVAILVSVAGVIVQVYRNRHQNRSDDSASEKDHAEALTTLQNLVNSLTTDNAELHENIKDLELRVAAQNLKITGPYRLAIEFTTLPEPRVTKADIFLMSKVEEKPKA